MVINLKRWRVFSQGYCGRKAYGVEVSDTLDSFKDAERLAGIDLDCSSVDDGENRE